jgi:alkylation response protein AidB-like acyl-CoA dehydrogenase
MPATERDGGWVLEGTKLLVAFAGSADWLLCAARTGAGSGPDGVTLFLVDPQAPGVRVTSLRTIAGGPLSAVELEGVEVQGSAVVGEVGRGWEPLAAAMTQAAVLQTATIVGAGHAVLDMTNQYAKDREQFGNPIGRYQAVQYLVTDVLIDLHRADLLARQAAYRIDAGKPYAREAAIAIAFGKEAAAHLHRQAHEVHAGVAFIVDHDLQLYSRRSKYWENNLGDARYHREQLARELQLT